MRKRRRRYSNNDNSNSACISYNVIPLERQVSSILLHEGLVPNYYRYKQSLNRNLDLFQDHIESAKKG